MASLMAVNQVNGLSLSSPCVTDLLQKSSKSTVTQPVFRVSRCDM
jgi:hypothetical protein